MKKLVLDLRTLTRHFCSFLSPEFDDRFSYVYDDNERFIDSTDRNILYQYAESLTYSAPSSDCLGYVAATPVEDIIYKILDNKDVDEAKFLLEHKFMSILIDDVYIHARLISKINKLVEGIEIERFRSYDVNFGEQILTPKELSGFWCQTLMPIVVDEYNHYEYRVNELLSSRIYTDKVIVDLYNSAPDKKAEKVVADYCSWHVKKEILTPEQHKTISKIAKKVGILF